MADITKRLAAAPDSRGRIVSIFVGAVLLPSIALSVVSFNAVPKQAENLKLSLLRQAQPTANVILMTGFGYDATHSLVRARQEGLKHVLYKPFRVDQLLSALQDRQAPK